jgi:Flp pilus assembly pilin Flp
MYHSTTPTAPSTPAAPTTPLQVLVSLLGLRVRAARSRARTELGASAVEWVIIAAIVVGICILVAGILRNALQGEAQEIGNEIQNQ